MKRLLFFILLCISVAGCIDNAYDLSKLDSSDDAGIVIGNDNSEFRMPLATISFSVASFKNKIIHNLLITLLITFQTCENRC